VLRIRGDTGQAVPLVAALVAVAASLTVAVGAFAGDIIDAARAQTAADAAALASLEGGRPAAARLAARHGAVVQAWSRHADQARMSVTVSVRVGDAVRTARAIGGDVTWPGS